MKNNSLKILLTVALLLTIITGCGTKYVTKDDFIEQSENKYSMEYDEYISPVSGLGNVKYEELVKYVGGDWTSYYYRFSNEEKAIKVMENIKTSMNEDGKQEDHYQRYTISYKDDSVTLIDGSGTDDAVNATTEVYKVAVRAKDIIIFIESKEFVEGDEDSIKEKIDDYLKSLDL